uniref:lupus La protein homolog n=1 Tax=Ciona intestinalis TaxID=7719 RepID=UPI000180CA86|nr:lupus La protein homolog [Ciona intestinalis]|eukprot:XP_002119316.1 lupus La protein homolog [Ciona intestinalis]
MSTETETVPENGADQLGKRLIRQIEFYFGDFNLHRDKFMQEEMKKNDGWFTMDTMLKFKRLSSMCSEPGTILAALKQSKSGLMEIDIENQSIRRKPSRAVPENDAKYKRDLKMRTVYAKGFPPTESIEDITEFMEEYGPVDGVQLRRQNKFQGAAFKGSIFTTFAKLEDAVKFVDAPMVYYKDKLLEKMTQEAFFKEKEEEKEMKNGRSHKKDNKKNEEEKEEQQDEEANFSWIHVTFLTDDTITHNDMKEKLQALEAPTFKFFSRYEKNGPEGYMVFTESDHASELMRILNETKEGPIMSIKTSENVTFSEMPEEQMSIAKDCYEEFRNRLRSGNRKKKGGGRFQDRKKRPFRQSRKFNDNGDEPSAKQSKGNDE